MWRSSCGWLGRWGSRGSYSFTMEPEFRFRQVDVFIPEDSITMGIYPDTLK